MQKWEYLVLVRTISNGKYKWADKEYGDKGSPEVLHELGQIRMGADDDDIMEMGWRRFGRVGALYFQATVLSRSPRDSAAVVQEAFVGLAF